MASDPASDKVIVVPPPTEPNSATTEMTPFRLAPPHLERRPCTRFITNDVGTSKRTAKPLAFAHVDGAIHEVAAGRHEDFVQQRIQRITESREGRRIEGGSAVTGASGIGTVTQYIPRRI